MGAVVISATACSLISGDIKETNELGEWVVAKPQTFRYKSYPLSDSESILGLTKIVAKKQRYYNECLQGKTRTRYEPIWGRVEYTESCSKEHVNTEQHDFSSASNYTLSEAEKKLSTARILLANNDSVNKAVKGVVWRGISKEIGKGEEKIKDRVYWCFNPALSKSDKKQWISLLNEVDSTQEISSDPDNKMYQRLYERICKVAWKS